MACLFDLAEWWGKACHWSSYKNYCQLLGQLRNLCRFENPIFLSAWDNSYHISESLLSHLAPLIAVLVEKHCVPHVARTGSEPHPPRPREGNAAAGGVTCHRKQFNFHFLFFSLSVLMSSLTNSCIVNSIIKVINHFLLDVHVCSIQLPRFFCLEVRGANVKA